MEEPERNFQNGDEQMKISTGADEEGEIASKPSDLLSQSILSIDAKTPKQLYYEQVDAETDAAVNEALTNLYESGFTDFKMNKVLFLKYKDVNTVANQLLTGALTESQFAQVFN